VTRKKVRIAVDELVELIRHPAQLDPFFIDWRCRLCGYRTGALDRTTALDTASHHLALDHAATGGYRRRKR
jgi:hypothetical protein